MGKRYYIKKGYISQESNTYKKVRDEKYWTEERIFYSQFYQYHIYKYAQKLIIKNKLTSVLDIGCGVGTKLAKLIYPICQQITGIDQSEAIEYCRLKYPSIEFLVDDLENPVLKLMKYDLIICADVIEHLLDPDNLLKFIRENAKSTTFCIFSTPERDILRGKNCMKSEKPEHVREWNRLEFYQYLTNSGFDIVKHELRPFIKFVFNKQVVMSIFSTYRKLGTITTNQLVVCKKNNAQIIC